MSYNISNSIIVVILSILYILFINKLAIILSNYDDEYEDKDAIKKYTIIIYIISIMGIVISLIFFQNNKNNGNIITKWSLRLGGIILLIYLITNYWDYLDEYSKLILLSVSICSIVYYIYQFY